MEINQHIKKALKFLEKEQKEGGEFTTYFSTSESFENFTYVRSPFITMFVIHALQFENNPISIRLRKKAMNFLKDYKESDFSWKFFKDTDIPKGFIYNSISSDLDDTACALICFKREGERFDKKVIQKILAKQDDGGGFLTYFYDWAFPTDIDCVVNANVLYLLSLLNVPKFEKPIHNLFIYLKSIVIGGSFSENTLTYEHYLSFTYALSRAYKYGNLFRLTEIKDTILSKIDEIKVKNPLEASLLVLTQLNFGKEPDKDLIKYIIKNQGIDGGFNAYTFFSGPRDFHGKKIYFSSRALTTALVFEALISYLISRDIESIDKKLENPILIKKTIIAKTNDIVLAKKISNLIKYEGRYACLLDLYSETQKPIYFYEGEFQHNLLLLNLKEFDIAELKTIEASVKNYFEFEEEIKEKLKNKKEFSDEKIKEYISRKSADTYCYAHIAKLFINLDRSFIELLHIRQELADILDDLNDYENDLKQNQPNILLLYFSNLNYIPKKNKGAIIYAKEIGIDKRIIIILTSLIKKAQNLKIDNFPLLHTAIKDKYNKIKNALDFV